MLDIVNMLMDKDNLFKIGLTACALGISIFILWGPKLGKKGNAGGLVGLQNLGLTCFLNSLLQALASCPIFIDWLEDLKGNGPVTDALLSILSLLCYERSDQEEDEGWYDGGDVASPKELIGALSRHGWTIAPQEQDTHELFLQLVTTLEEEDTKSNLRNKGLDAFCDDRLQSHEVTSHGDLNKSLLAKSAVTNGNVSLGRSLSSPFRGYLTSQLQCLSCGHKSSVRYDKFDSLSLHLPAGEGDVKLKDMLDGLVRCEVLDFACEVCAKTNPSINTKATKTVRIGKLPKCLCLHVSRTNMSSGGVVYKRENYVDFPEFISMTGFTQNVTPKDIKKCGDSLYGGGGGILLDRMQEVLLSPDQEGNNNSAVPQPVTNKLPVANGLMGGSTKHMYRLKAVVEHKGSVDNGHFVTYRRGPLRSSHRHRSCPSRWYFTSDAEVRKSSMCDALLANAYMIFYEKCSS